MTHTPGLCRDCLGGTIVATMKLVKVKASEGGCCGGHPYVPPQYVVQDGDTLVGRVIGRSGYGYRVRAMEPAHLTLADFDTFADLRRAVREGAIPHSPDNATCCVCGLPGTEIDITLLDETPGRAHADCWEREGTA